MSILYGMLKATRMGFGITRRRIAQKYNTCKLLYGYHSNGAEGVCLRRPGSAFWEKRRNVQLHYRTRRRVKARKLVSVFASGPSATFPFSVHF